MMHMNNRIRLAIGLWTVLTLGLVVWSVATGAKVSTERAAVRAVRDAALRRLRAGNRHRATDGR